MEPKIIAVKATQAAAQHGPFLSGENIVYLMGLSFMIGSLFTIFILVLLDFMKRDRGTDR